MKNAVNNRPPILIEGPRLGDAEFYGLWLPGRGGSSAALHRGDRGSSF